MIKKAFLIVFVVLISSKFVHAESSFEYFGDVMQALPAYVAIYSLAIEDYDGLIQLAIGTSSTLITTYALKYSFDTAAKKYPKASYISQRPNNGSYNGFPSGHTSFAFSSVGFAYKRYGYKVLIPTAILATLTGISRVYAKRHTITQVVFGGAIGFVTSYAFAKQFSKNNISLGVTITPNNGYIISFNKIF